MKNKLITLIFISSVFLVLASNSVFPICPTSQYTPHELRAHLRTIVFDYLSDPFTNPDYTPAEILDLLAFYRGEKESLYIANCDTVEDLLERTITFEVACNDEIDNDGDSLIDLVDPGCGNDPADKDESNCGDGVCTGAESCSSCSLDCGICPEPVNGIFFLKNILEEILSFNDNGDVILKGKLQQNGAPVATNDDEFIVQDGNGNAVAIVNSVTGNMIIRGSLFEGEASLTPPSTSDDFVVKHASGDVLAYISQSGNLYLKGALVEDGGVVVETCTASAWSCTTWSPTVCPSSNEQTRTCTLLNTACTNPDLVKPSETLSCILKSISLSANPVSVAADGIATSTITGTTSDGASGIMIGFSTETLGHPLTYSPESCTTDETGGCSVTLRSSKVGTVTLSGRSNGYGAGFTTVNYIESIPNEIPNSQAILFADSIVKGSTNTLQCLVADSDLHDQPINEKLTVKLWAGQCDKNDCSNTKSWVTGNGVTYFNGALMDAPATGGIFTKSFVVTQDGGTGIVAACQPVDSIGAEGNVVDTLPIVWTVSCPASVPTFSSISAIQDPLDAGAVKIVFTASEGLGLNPLVAIKNQATGAKLGDAIFVSKTGLQYTYKYTVQSTGVNRPIEIEIKEATTGSCPIGSATKTYGLLDPISNVATTPSSGRPGTVFIITAGVTDDPLLSDVKAIIKLGGTQIDAFTLLDDGSNGDGQANDDTYGKVWGTSGRPEGAYDVTIEIEDIWLNKYTSTSTIELIELCSSSIVPGHNNVDANRVNMVFTGFNYADKNDFIDHVRKSIDFDGTEGGIFSQEPFKSNKDKFNFWFVDELGILPNNIDCFENFNTCVDATKNIASSCVVSNKNIVGLVNSPFRSFAWGELQVTSNAYDIKRTVVHEMGHSLGQLRDEYLEGSVGSAWTGGFEYDLNIVRGTAEDCSNPSLNPWAPLIGYGCGQNSVIDCVTGYDAHNTEESQLDCTIGDKFTCYIEAACYEGTRLYPVGSYRGAFSTIMGTKGAIIPLDTFEHSFGTVNERLICNQIEAKTGSAGGICNIIPDFAPMQDLAITEFIIIPDNIIQNNLAIVSIAVKNIGTKKSDIFRLITYSRSPLSISTYPNFPAVEDGLEVGQTATLTGQIIFDTIAQGELGFLLDYPSPDLNPGNDKATKIITVR
jgi:hypothetical protein